MAEIKLTPEMLGEQDAEGNITVRPTRDTLGNDLTGLRLPDTRKYLKFNGKDYFVCIPNGKDHPDHKYSLAEAARPQVVKPGRD